MHKPSGTLGLKKFGPKIFLLIFSLDWIILRKLVFVFLLLFFCLLRKHPLTQPDYDDDDADVDMGLMIMVV